MVRFLACAGASSQARGNSQRAHPRRARRSPARGRVRALYAVAEVVWPCVWFKMSSRSLGGPTTGPSVRVAHSSVETESKRSAGKKVVRRARGRKRAGLQIASAPRKGIQARLQRLIVGGGSCWHLRCGAKLKSFGSRKGTKRWKASRFASSQLSFTGQRWKQTWPRDPIHTSSDEGRHHNPMWRADRRRVGDREVRGWFASSHRR
jgi:hypothetical protein